jgi:hypothetical protein
MVSAISPRQRETAADHNPSSKPPLLIAGRSKFWGPNLTTEHDDDDEAWQFTRDDEEVPERSLVELLAVRITVHVEILDAEAAAFEESGKWNREQRGTELASDDALRCLALFARREAGALHGKQISDLLGDAIVEAAHEADPDDPEFVVEYTDECRRAASRIMRAIAVHLDAERRPRS